MVYRLYCDNPHQVRNHTQIVHRNISMAQISATVERHTFARNKSRSPLKSLYGNDLQWKLNRGKVFYNKISKEVLF